MQMANSFINNKYGTINGTAAWTDDRDDWFRSSSEVLLPSPHSLTSIYTQCKLLANIASNPVFSQRGPLISILTASNSFRGPSVAAGLPSSPGSMPQQAPERRGPPATRCQQVVLVPARVSWGKAAQTLPICVKT